MSEKIKIKNPNTVPPSLRDVVVFPNMVVPLFVGRSKSIKALEKSMELNQKILLVTQKDPSDDDPKTSNLFKVGTLSSILQLLKLPDGTVKVLAEVYLELI